MQSHEDLAVWKKAVALCTLIYRLTEKFPSREMYGLTSQIRRAAVSVPSNIAEGRRRGTDADFGHFLRMAHGSLAELETQLLISKELAFCTEKEFENVRTQVTEMSKMLHGMIKALR
ncbi:four helix bundle protein [Candidatus Kaiserbacteria bacterium RIFCSPLOWO2_12_FULL_53_8]|uniref:Four helix bundle protein n=2 Tax=Candidatus Kaiseribacteriota TaxID=1752734 RepID=A0A1F6CTB7_9BACT|nr:MAG: four helix bundle protein [Candidatus Kaiserbacteria bacterium RIFCSPHIGHO2_01_FULL_53_29]OGG91397.1 MAG: four helix bundle protein [Candidatus Kaiserbacteria bacterium RIFCSPLOWO2_12_FULL_53_8]